ncbi:AAA domain-containing protein [Georgenia soli]|uniref:AAA domain-containing protein n=1 Tax=Georgenia soli TaxID=638953 RepID=A0A2A9EPS9_9MICO|nr:AAA family ATPase [Georgenia soli]PFG40606.1 AAA domain-containing protein [Georgenia soli]
MAERQLSVATAPFTKTAHWRQSTITWSGLKAWMGDPGDSKESGGYLLGELRKTTVDHVDRAGCTALHRRKGSVVSRCVLALDADSATPELVERVKALGVATLVHTTWSHTPDEPRYRILILLDRDVSPEEYRLLARAVMKALGIEQFDTSCEQAERFMFRPATQDPDAYQHWTFDGDPLDVGSWLARQLDRLLDEPDAAPEPAERRSAPVTASAEYAAHVRGVIAWTLGKLDELRDLPNGFTVSWPGAKAPDKEPGEVGWDYGAYLAAQRLVQASNSGIGYSLEDAKRDFTKHAPPADDRYDPEHKWEDAVAFVGDQGTPYQSAAEEFDAVEADEPSSADVNGVRERFARLDLYQLLDPNRPEREWVVHDLVPAGTAVAIVAPAGVGKSLLLLAMALDIARGKPDFAGLVIPQARRVLIVDMENTADDYAERLSSLGITRDNVADLDDRFVLIDLPPLAALDTAEGGRELMSILDAYDIGPGDVVVLDSFQRVTEGKENDSDTARAFYRHTGAVLKKRGVTVVRTDNTGKDAEKGARGTSSKRDDVDLELLLTRDADDPGRLYLKPGKSRLAGIASLTLTQGHDEDGWLIYTASSNPWRAKVDHALQVLAGLDLPSDASQRDTEKAVKGAGHKVPRAALREALKLRRELAGDDQ